MFHRESIVKKTCKKGKVGMMKLDPRTHLIILLLASILSMFASDRLQVHLLVVASAVYMLCHKLIKQTVYFVLLYIVFLAIISVLPDVTGTLILIFYTFARMIPMIMIGAVLVHSAPSSIMCAFEKMFIPKPILIMICILIRFFPVIVLEMKSIRDGIRARGIFPHWYSVLQHPAMAYECFFMPLIVRCLKLSSELAASAELRGIECGRGRTSIHPVGFKAVDYVMVGGFALMSAAIYWTGVVSYD
ncbi:energy-coupling factor transporter transmembrane component T [Bacillus paramycoides]|uniref:energy-coupling factor transporter transmembrane component T family protein n=1 Tax=Bacillus paramycoides TaxID=2026194 RepID=UPI0030B98DDF